MTIRHPLMMLMATGKKAINKINYINQALEVEFHEPLFFDALKGISTPLRYSYLSPSTSSRKKDVNGFNYFIFYFQMDHRKPSIDV